MILLVLIIVVRILIELVSINDSIIIYRINISKLNNNEEELGHYYHYHS